MKTDEIEKLLARFYEGETEETEEKELRRFFMEEDVPDHLLAEKEIFMQLTDQSVPEVPEGMEQRLNEKIDEWGKAEKQANKARRQARIVRMRWIGSIAASLLILFSVGTYIYNQESTPATLQDTCATPEEAYVQAQKALVLLSSNLNKGVEQMESVQETTEKVNKKINKELNRINL